MKFLSAVVAALLAICDSGWSQVAAPPPASAFGALAAASNLAISPDGRHVAIAASVDGRTVVSIATIDRPDMPRLALGDVEVTDLRWLANDYVLATVLFWIDGMRTREVETRGAQLRRTVAITPDGKLASTLLQQDQASQLLVRQEVIGIAPGPPPRALMIGRAGPTPLKIRTAALWSVDPATGQGELVEEGVPGTLDWGFDLAGRPRVRIDRLANGDFTVSYRLQGAMDWKVVWASKGLEDRRSYHGYSPTEDALIFSRHGPAGYEVVLKGLNGQPEVIVGRPHEVAPLFAWDPLRLTVAGLVEYAGQPSLEWRDPDLAAVHAALAKAFKGRTPRISAWSSDRKRFLVGLSSSDLPTSWYLYDQTSHQISPLVDEYPQLAGIPLGATTWMAYRARDGLDLHAYLTLPPGAAPGRRPPLIVLPHDGPDRRDEFDFDYLTQFLATRGYAVLRPQYRGSSGFGPELQAAGDGAWADAMQTDLMDGVAALAAQGVVDPQRVCIVGNGFGGYLALAGAADHADAYRCAASISGISDVAELMGHPGRTSAGRAIQLWWAKQAKHPPQALARLSPSEHAEAVRGPVLLIAAADDRIVPPKQSERMRDALRKAGASFEYKVVESADHDFPTAATRTQMLETLDAFLAKNLPVKP